MQAGGVVLLVRFADPSGSASTTPPPAPRYKAYLDDFAAYCSQLGGTTAEVMTDLLAFEVGREGQE
jgi:hypothetical protein